MFGVLYTSRSLTKSKQLLSNLKTKQRLCFSCYKNNWNLLLGDPITAYNDHKALHLAFENCNNCERLATRLYIMEKHAFEVCYVEGRQNVLADLLSRSVGEKAVDMNEKK